MECNGDSTFTAVRANLTQEEEVRKREREEVAARCEERRFRTGTREKGRGLEGGGASLVSHPPSPKSLPPSRMSHSAVTCGATMHSTGLARLTKARESDGGEGEEAAGVIRNEELMAVPAQGQRSAQAFNKRPLLLKDKKKMSDKSRKKRRC